MNSRYVLLDRDGTIIVDRHYLSDPTGVELLPGATDALRKLTQLGCRLAIVTNQSGIARGYFSEAALAAIHARLTALLAATGISLAGIYHCPHDDAANCRCRKPRPGMAEQAAADHGIELTSAIVIGDRDADIGLAAAIGATSILVRTGSGAETELLANCRPDYVADDLRAAADLIEKLWSAQ